MVVTITLSDYKLAKKQHDDFNKQVDNYVKRFDKAIQTYTDELVKYYLHKTLINDKSISHDVKWRFLAKELRKSGFEPIANKPDELDFSRITFKTLGIRVIDRDLMSYVLKQYAKKHGLRLSKRREDSFLKQIADKLQLEKKAKEKAEKMYKALLKKHNLI
jgi:transcription initiation factor TFIIIB Brf1 subunit/transcription initiation factor TFIIB